jgi:RNA polymerase sigma-70 factor (ECF subfamily)
LVRKKEQDLINYLNDKDYTLAFQAIISLYHEMLYWHIRKLVLVHEDADDVLQNTYIKIYKGIKNFKQKSSIKTWVYRIAYNESIRHLEKAGRKKMEVSDQVAQLYWAKLTADPYFDAAACEKKIHDFMAELPERKRQVFLMKYFEEQTFDQIGATLKINTNSVKTIFYNLRKQLEEKIKAAI